LRNLLGGLEKTSVSVGQNIDALLARTNKALDGVSLISESVGPAEKKNIRRALDQLVKMGEQLTAVTSEARVLVTRLNKGKGTAGAFLTREELYEDIKEMVRDLKRNPWKFLWRE
jgi:phospholipid/cholesterol/gamma-HCH transport system substrate-binding protein